MQMEVLCFTLCYMEHQCCPLPLPFDIKLHQEHLPLVLDRHQHLEHVSFHSLGKSWGVCSWCPLCTRAVLSSVVSLFPQGRCSVWFLCWLCRDVGDNTTLLMLDLSSSGQMFLCWSDVWHQLRLSKWNLSSMRGYSLRMCVPRGTGFLGCCCRLLSKFPRAPAVALVHPAPCEHRNLHPCTPPAVGGADFAWVTLSSRLLAAWQ